MTTRIASVKGMEILDSRGNPTIRAFLETNTDICTAASVPSGASTGENEAVELRDGGERYGGKGVLQGVKNINTEINNALAGVDVFDQAEIDRILIELDGTANKSRLGANAILGVSMAAARAAARSAKMELYSYLGGASVNRIPVPCMNIINGGEHADNSVDIQEFMVAPIGAPSFSEGLRFATETFHTLKSLLKKRQLATSVGDEGGFAPNLDSNEDAIEIILEAITKAGYEPGKDISLALDSAASSFSPELKDSYDMRWSGAGKLTTDEMIALADKWAKAYPIISWEDPLAENDWDGFSKLTAQLGDKLDIVGDDLFVTNTKYIKRGIEEKSANSVLIKLNQIGTVTESIEAVKMCQAAGWKYFISHRSGETEDTFLADFAVAMGGGQLKTGSSSRSERMAKYNRLLEIEMQLGKNNSYYW